MDLWIRNQDRHTLQKVTKLYVEKFDIEGYYAIYDFPEECDEVDIGHYSSKERALEILDEIQNILKNNQYGYKVNVLGEKVDIIPNQIYVYEMPKE